ncbi:MAG: rod shape-determining protein MreC, partial [Verrucomicrobiota bacterium]
VSSLVSADTAVVLLLTDEMCQVTAKVSGTEEQGILSGRRGVLKTAPILNLRYLSKEIQINTADKVLSSGEGELFPPGLLLGEVIDFKVGKIDGEARIQPLVNFDTLKDVFILMPDIQRQEADDSPAMEPVDENAVEEAPALPTNPLTE